MTRLSARTQDRLLLCAFGCSDVVCSLNRLHALCHCVCTVSLYTLSLLREFFLVFFISFTGLVKGLKLLLGGFDFLVTY
jgi:hypothetical protein